jgi:hypothetical protein
VPRIRSIHPGIWTDEAFVSLSPHARLLLIGIWTEADDKGAFDWSPLKLKMRLLPGDMVETGALLQELVDCGLVMQYDFAGKSYGAVRNFAKWQRPKKPNDIHPMTETARLYAGHSPVAGGNPSRANKGNSPTSPPLVPHQSGNSWADGGWRMEDGEYGASDCSGGEPFA